MSPTTKAVVSAIRLLAAGCIIVGICLYLPDIFRLLSHQRPDSIFKMILKAIPLIAGGWLIWKSEAIAEHFTDDLD